MDKKLLEAITVQDGPELLFLKSLEPRLKALSKVQQSNVQIKFLQALNEEESPSTSRLQPPSRSSTSNLSTAPPSTANPFTSNQFEMISHTMPDMSYVDMMNH